MPPRLVDQRAANVIQVFSHVSPPFEDRIATQLRQAAGDNPQWLASGMDIEVSTLTTYESGSWMEEDGAQVLPVTARSDVAVAGGGMQGGTEITIDGTGVSWSELRLTADGRLLSRFSADTMNMTATVIAMGTIIPITQLRYDSLSVVR